MLNLLLLSLALRQWECDTSSSIRPLQPQPTDQQRSMFPNCLQTPQSSSPAPPSSSASSTESLLKPNGSTSDREPSRLSPQRRRQLSLFRRCLNRLARPRTPRRRPRKPLDLRRLDRARAARARVRRGGWEVLEEERWRFWESRRCWLSFRFEHLLSLS